MAHLFVVVGELNIRGPTAGRRLRHLYVMKNERRAETGLEGIPV